MEFFIKKNATLPVLKLQVVKDGRSEYDNFMKTIELSAIFFSMVDVETGIPKISSRPAGFVEKVFEDPNARPEYYIYYQFSKRDTSSVGRYDAQFMMRNDDGVLILPIREKLYINVQDSFIADDLPYENCYVSEFPCCVNGPYTTTTTTTPCPTCPSCTETPIITTTTTILPPTPTPSETPTPTPTITPTPTLTPTETELPLFNVIIETIISSGSVIFDINITLPYSIDSDYVCNIVKSFNVVTGSPIIVNTSVFVPKGEISGTTQVVIDDDWNRIAEGSELVSINQIAENINLNYDYVHIDDQYNFTPKPNPHITKTPTPTPTITPTPSITPNPTSSTTPTPTPTITPTKSLSVSDLTVYYGKLEKLFMDNTDVNLLNNLTTKNIKNKHLSYSITPGFCYLAVPDTLPQPSTFKNNVDSCDGFTIPFARIDDISVVDLYGNVIIYYVYRSFISTSSSVDIWVCN